MGLSREYLLVWDNRECRFQQYLGARAGCVCFDPSFPEAFHVINGVPGLAVAAIVAIGLTQRSDEK